MERETKIAPRYSKKSTPRYNPISKKRPTHSTVSSSDDDDREPSPDGLRDSTENSTETEKSPEVNEGRARNWEETQNVATVSTVAGTVTREKGSNSSGGCDGYGDVDVAVVGEDLDPIAADDVNLSSGDAIDDRAVVDSEHNVLEEESPAAEIDEMETLGSSYDISHAKESNDGEEEDGNSEDDREEEEDGNEESENDGDCSEGSKEDKDNKERSEDDKDNNEENEDDKGPCASIDDPLCRREGLQIHVGGLDKNTVEDDLIEVFRQFGEIKDIRIKHPTKRKSKGFAFIQYATIDQAKNAVSELKDGIEVRGKRVKVSASQENATLFMDNICMSWTKEHVLVKLKDYGIEHIVVLHLPNDPEDGGKIKGFALLEFSSHTDAVAAYQRLRRPDAIFGCDRSAKVAFMRSQVRSIENLSQVKSSISKGVRGGFKVKEISEKASIPTTHVHAKSGEAKKECEMTEQACSSKTKGNGSEKKRTVNSEEKWKPLKSNITGSESNIAKSRTTENQVVGMQSKSTKINHKKKRLPSKSNDQGKRKLEHDYNKRPSKKRQGNKQGTPRNATKSPRRHPQVRERRHVGYREPAHGAISGSKRLCSESDMEPHAGYVKPAALKQSQHHAGYPEPAPGNQHQGHLGYQTIGSHGLIHVKYLEPSSLGNKHQHHASYLEPSVGRAVLSHAGHLERAAGLESHTAYHHGLRRDGVYNNRVSSSAYAGVSALPSYVSNLSYQSYAGYEVDRSRVGGYGHISQTYPLPPR